MQHTPSAHESNEHTETLGVPEILEDIKKELYASVDIYTYQQGSQSPTQFETYKNGLRPDPIDVTLQTENGSIIIKAELDNEGYYRFWHDNVMLLYYPSTKQVAFGKHVLDPNELQNDPSRGVLFSEELTPDHVFSHIREAIQQHNQELISTYREVGLDQITQGHILYPYFQEGGAFELKETLYAYMNEHKDIYGTPPRLKGKVLVPHNFPLDKTFTFVLETVEGQYEKISLHMQLGIFHTKLLDGDDDETIDASDVGYYQRGNMSTIEDDTHRLLMEQHAHVVGDLRKKLTNNGDRRPKDRHMNQATFNSLFDFTKIDTNHPEPNFFLANLDGREKTEKVTRWGRDMVIMSLSYDNAGYTNQVTEGKVKAVLHLIADMEKRIHNNYDKRFETTRQQVFDILMS